MRTHEHGSLALMRGEVVQGLTEMERVIDNILVAYYADISEERMSRAGWLMFDVFADESFLLGCAATFSARC
jgi:hypothetical protein